MTVVNITDYKPHWSGETVCLQCGDESVSVAPVGTTFLECDKCNTGKKVAKYPCSSDIRFACNCGCWAFCITTDGPMCVMCGNVADWEEVV